MTMLFGNSYANNVTGNGDGHRSFMNLTLYFMTRISMTRAWATTKTLIPMVMGLGLLLRPLFMSRTMLFLVYLQRLALINVIVVQRALNAGSHRLILLCDAHSKLILSCRRSSRDRSNHGLSITRILAHPCGCHAKRPAGSQDHHRQLRPPSSPRRPE